MTYYPFGNYAETASHWDDVSGRNFGFLANIERLFWKVNRVFLILTWIQEIFLKVIKIFKVNFKFKNSCQEIQNVLNFLKLIIAFELKHENALMYH